MRGGIALLSDLSQLKYLFCHRDVNNHAIQSCTELVEREFAVRLNEPEIKLRGNECLLFGLFEVEH